MQKILNIEEKEIQKFFDEHKRKSDTNKYDYGHVLVVAGSLGMLGASVLSATSAMRAGAGLVTVAVPEGLIVSAMSHFVECMTLPVPTDTKFKGFFDEKSTAFLKEFLIKKKIDIVVLGPGIGRELETQNFVKEFLKILIDLKIDILLDADGLFAISNNKEQIQNNFEIDFFKNLDIKNNILITPHEKEFQRLLNIKNFNFVKENRFLLCQELAKINKINCILKGKETVISDGEVTYKNIIGNAGMATAGSGDVLSGIIAGIKSQFKDIPFLEAAKIGVYLHALSGNFAKKELGEISLIASDILKFFPKSLLFLSK
jgi:hydroxyethylthiazole kinase-like uncharacterized protein yjeF